MLLYNMSLPHSSEQLILLLLGTPQGANDARPGKPEGVFSSSNRSV